MFNTIKNALKTPDVRKRLWYTLLLIIIFRLGCFISVPTVDSTVLDKGNGIQELVEFFKGNYDSDSAGSFSVDFSGLAVNEKIEKVTSGSEPTKIVIKVYEQRGSELIGETTLNLDANCNIKNSVTVIIDNTESPWTTL